jgi:hypothetical protein
MADATKTIADYGAAWNEEDAGKRKALLEQAWADDGAYCDPVADIRGRDALQALIAQFREQQKGATIELTSGVDQHHDRIRFAWAMKDAGGKTVMEGIDAGRLAADGKIAEIVGFWGAPPAKQAQ